MTFARSARAAFGTASFGSVLELLSPSLDVESDLSAAGSSAAAFAPASFGPSGAALPTASACPGLVTAGLTSSALRGASETALLSDSTASVFTATAGSSWIAASGGRLSWLTSLLPAALVSPFELAASAAPAASSERLLEPLASPLVVSFGS